MVNGGAALKQAHPLALFAFVGTGPFSTVAGVGSTAAYWGPVGRRNFSRRRVIARCLGIRWARCPAANIVAAGADEVAEHANTHTGSTVIKTARGISAS